VEDIGIKVSQEGINVRSCSDKDLLFSSSLPSLEILMEKEVVPNSDSSGYIPSFSHNLGYTPVFLAYTIDDPYHLKKPSLTLDEGYVFVNDKNVYSSLYGGKSLIRIFNYNMESQYSSDLSQTTSKIGGKNENFGIKVSRKNKDIKIAPMKEQIISSGGRSPIIHMSGTINVKVGDYVNIYHGLGYIPMYLVYTKSTIDFIGTTGYCLREPYSNNLYAMEYVSSTMIKITNTYGSPDRDFSYIIFKDPMG